MRGWRWDLITRVRNSLQLLSPWLCSRSRFSFLPLTVDTGVRLEGLGYYLMLYLDDYLATKQLYNERRKTLVTDSLRQILSEIIALVPQIENCRKLLQDAMNQSHDWPWQQDRPMVGRMNKLNTKLEGQTGALLFAFSTVIEDAINKSETDVSTTEYVVSPALLLCRVCALVRNGNPGLCCADFSLTRYLFWAGLRLPSSSNSAGDSPQIVD